ncbi:hypothetical protein MKW94_001710 [Papaver nudicaule]|uniref:DNA repair protein RAD4 n=1 Tax=Papaver nudicaule TaxID=74823 RepID=A0AA41RKS4_PAPNU|nr:hypothetical protein [Papaver nudicaule]
MRTTRSQSKQKPEKQEEEASTSTPKGISRVGVGKLPKRVNSRGGGSSKAKKSRNLDASTVSGNGNDEEKVSIEVTNSAVLETESVLLEKNVKEGRSVGPDKEEDTDDFDWEDGCISGGESIYGNSDNNVAREMVIEFNDSPSSSKRKPVRRASAEEKELAELAHKTHLLCLLARGRIIDRACSDPLIQAALLSLLPTYLQKKTEVPKLTAKDLGSIVRWFHDNFHVANPSNSDRPFESNLAAAVENRKGTTEEISALSVALFRALNLSTRFVSILDVVSLKPDMSMSGCSSQDAVRAENDVFKSSTLMVAKSDPISISPTKFTLPKTGSIEDSGTSRGGAHKIKESSSARRIDQSKSAPASGTLSDRKQVISASDKSSDLIACSTNKVEGSKRKGDLEFELQLEMALAATAAGAHDGKLGSEMKDLPCSSSHNSSPYKKLKTVQSEEVSDSRQGISIAIGSRKVGAPLYWAEVFCSGENMTGKWVHVDAVNAVVDGEEKVEAAAAACRRSLRYVVAFAGNGAKDVTRRYCLKWYQIASKRINSCWWDAVLAPLNGLESVATAGLVHLESSSNNTSSNLCKVNASEKRSSTEGGVISSLIQEYLPGNCSTNQKHGMKDSKQNLENIGVQSSSQCGVATRNSLEDMELQTRALTEPLPTNQQAYRTHHLYALERWLTKNQILHPKGPILGYCSGHPVYPRNCVQTLHSEHRWLREALQVKASEKPAKLVKRSSKVGKVQASEPEADKEDEGEENIALYGRWQLEPLNLPYAVNGVVPRNERGQVDVWSEKCLPHGTVHLRLPRVYTVAKRLGIDSAPAMVGFDFRNGRTVPIFEGIVVCTEFKDAILQAYAEEEERREAEEKKRNEAQAISRWYQLLSSIITRQRLNQTYGADSCSQTSHVAKQNDNYICNTVIAETEDDMQSNVQHRQDYVHNSSSDFTQDHEHIYPIDNQSFDEESSIRTKRCPCGFSVQVEEL